MHYLSLLLFVPMFAGNAQNAVTAPTTISPLSNFSEEWDAPKYQTCNSAATVSYMSEQEKNVIWILNLARVNPKLFCQTVVKKYPEYSINDELEATSYYKSLVTTMNSMKPLGLLQPDQQCYNSAQCHAYNSGKTGYEGHDRTGSCKAKEYYNGECCDYSNADAIDIIMSLLIDEDVASLGHRNICLGSEYKTIGVSIQPHKKWVTNAVLDLHL